MQAKEMAKRPKCFEAYRGASPIIKRTPLGTYRRPLQRVQGGSWGGGCFLMGEVPLYIEALNEPTLCNLNTIAGSTQGPSHFNQKSIRKNLASFGEKCPQMAPRRNPFLQKGALGQPSKGLARYRQGGGGKARLLRGLYLR